MKRAIIIADARDLTDPTRPACMAEVAGEPVLHHQIRAFLTLGIHEFVVTGGAPGDPIEGPGGIDLIRTFPEKPDAGELLSLFSAGPELVGPVLVARGDRLFRPSAVQAAMTSAAPGSLVLDATWPRGSGGGRTDLCRTSHPSSGSLVLQLGEGVRIGDAFGPWIGLARFDAALVARLWSGFARCRARGSKMRFRGGRGLDEASLTDLLELLVEAGERVVSATILGGWSSVVDPNDPMRLQGLSGGE